MAEWSDIAMCYRWLHDRSEKRYYILNMGMTIPVIILSTLTGTANFGIQSFVGDNQEIIKYANMSVGAVSLVAGILATLNNFLRFAQLSEGHKVAGVSWGKFQRLIAVELALHPNDRMDCMDFLKICRGELDRMIEQSPPITDYVIKEFDDKFGSIKDVKKPDICNSLEHTYVFRDTESRLKSVAADAALLLRHRKGLLKELIMPEFEKKIDKAIEKRLDTQKQSQQPNIYDDFTGAKAENTIVEITLPPPATMGSDVQKI